MAILDLCDQAVIVVENVVPTLQTVRGFFELLDEVDFPASRQKVLLNRYSTRAGGPSAQEVSRYLGRDADYVIPFDRKVIAAANTGKPFITSPIRWSKAAKSIREIADDIEGNQARVSVPKHDAEPAALEDTGLIQPPRLAGDGGGDLG
jgi:pilus assembly protein CpaE